MKRSLTEIAEAVGGRVRGDAGVQLSGVAAFETAGAGDLVFVERENFLAQALASKAGAIIAGEFAADAKASKPLLIVRHPKLAFARAAKLLVTPRKFEPGVHSTAIVHHSVKLGKLVTIQPNAVLAEGVAIGDRTRIGPGVAIGEGVQIGAGCNIAANVTIYPGTRIGNNVIVHSGAVLGSDGFGFVRDPESGAYEKFPQIGTLEIHDDVEIGANTTVDRGALGATIIGRGVKIDNLVQVAHNVEIGENVVIAGQAGISGSVTIGPGVVLAGQVGISDHCRIEAGVILGAQCGVTTGKIVRNTGDIYWGTPARPLQQRLKELAALGKLAKQQKQQK